MTSEERFEIIEQPQPTCPMIDSLIKRANEIISTLKGYSCAEEEELRSMADEADTLIRSFEDELNAIRKNADQRDRDPFYRSRIIDEWMEFARKQQDIHPEFVKIVEENFWEILA